MQGPWLGGEAVWCNKKNPGLKISWPCPLYWGAGVQHPPAAGEGDPQPLLHLPAVQRLLLVRGQVLPLRLSHPGQIFLRDCRMRVFFWVGGYFAYARGCIIWFKLLKGPKKSRATGSWNILWKNTGLVWNILQLP